jgi:chromate transporter
VTIFGDGYGLDGPSSPRPQPEAVSLATATRTWFAISLRTFGGPAGQIAVMHRELVDERRWIGDQRFLHALSYCTLLPGPEAQQLAIYLGWLLNGPLGGLIAGILFVLPGYLALMGLSAVYAQWGPSDAVTAVFAGLTPAVVAIVSQAVWRLGSRTLRRRAQFAIALGAFAGLFAFDLPFPVVIAAAGITGYGAHRLRPSPSAGLSDHEPGGASESDVGPPRRPLISDDELHDVQPSLPRAIRVVGLGVALWAAPIVTGALTLGRSHVIVEQGLFFAGTAVVTFGGAYAVLSFVAQRAVGVHHWLSPSEMIHGLALAETTPGPLIMVVQFVGFLGAFRDPGSLDPWLSAILGATMVVWVTFVPCFVFVFLGAPHVEGLRHRRGLSATLTGITAAVVGVIANLAVFLAVHALFGRSTVHDWGPVHLTVPVWSSLSARAVVVAALAFVLVLRFELGVLRVLAICSAVGAIWYLALG